MAGRTTSRRRTTSRKAWGLTLLGLGGVLISCGGKSTAQGTRLDSGAGGDATFGGRQSTGSGGDHVSSVGGSIGTVGTAGAAGAAVASGGHAGDPSSGGGGGADACEDLCRAQQPACCSEGLRCVESVPRCRIDLLGGSVGTVYEYADLKQKTDPSADVLVSFEDTEIDRVAAEAPSASRFELHLDSEASARMAIFRDASGKPFRLSCDEQELFVGVLYPLEGAAALRTPVLHIEDDPGNDGIVLLLGAWQGVWAIPTSGDVTLRERIDRPELRAAFCARGILSELEDP